MIELVYIEGKGLQDKHSFELSFGDNRNEIRERLKYNQSSNFGRFEGEDSYEKLFNENLWLRLGFKVNNLDSIEILEGSVQVKGVVISIGKGLKKSLKKLENYGYGNQEHPYGYVVKDLNLDLGSNRKNGAFELQESVAWVLMSLDIKEYLGE